MEPFQQMGAQIERAFRAANYDERAFPALAAEALAARALHREIGWADVLRWTLTADELPHQNDLKARVGDVPVTVYHGRRFFIQVLCWTEGTTAIHRHGFSGAFQVLEGTGLHTRYPTRRPSRASPRSTAPASSPRSASRPRATSPASAAPPSPRCSASRPDPKDSGAGAFDDPNPFEHLRDGRPRAPAFGSTPAEGAPSVAASMCPPSTLGPILLTAGSSGIHAFRTRA